MYGRGGGEVGGVGGVVEEGEGEARVGGVRENPVDCVCGGVCVCVYFRLFYFVFCILCVLSVLSVV